MKVEKGNVIFSEMNVNERKEAIVVRGVIGAGNRFLEEPRMHSSFLGFSLTRSISDRHLELLVEWANKQSKVCPVLIDDMEYRHNFIVFAGKSERAAEEFALGKGLELAARISGIVERVAYLDGEPIELKVHSESYVRHRMGVHQSSQYWNLHTAGILGPLNRAYEENADFRQRVDDQVEKSLGKRLEGWKISVCEEKYLADRRRLANFVLEETAVTINYVERGYTVELYMGSPIQVVVDLYDKNCLDLSKLRETLQLKREYGHINLGIERSSTK